MGTYRDTYGYMGLRVSQIRDTMSIMKNEMLWAYISAYMGKGLEKQGLLFRVPLASMIAFKGNSCGPLFVGVCT